MKDSHKTNRALSRQQKRAIPFFTVLALLTVVAFILPLRPSTSMAEKRTLTAFPEFSAESFWDGSYFDQIGIWFSDTFPGREAYIRVAQDLEAAQGLNRNVVVIKEDQNADNDRLDELLAEAEASPAVAQTPAPTPEASPEPEPALVQETAEETASGEESSPTPEPTPDAWEEVEHWDGLDAEDEMLREGTLIALGDMVFTAQGFSQDDTDSYAAICNEFCRELSEEGIRFFNLPVPTAVGVLVASDFLPQIKCADQSKMLRYLFSREDEAIYKVNVFNNLLAHKDEYIYYRGDHHWTALGAYYAYEVFCGEAGFTPVPLSEYEEVNMGLFQGTLYWRAGARDLYEDELIAYVPPGDITMDIVTYPSLKDPVQDRSQKDPSSKYNVFIAGDNDTTVLTNPALPEDSCCIIVKDSFGNPFTIYLAQHYRRVVILDYRHADQTILQYVKAYQPQDVILLNSIGLTQRPGSQSILTTFLKDPW